jgi:hypothetical protein
VRGIEASIFAGIFGKTLVELIPRNLPDVLSHFWLPDVVIPNQVVVDIPIP